MAKIFCVANQKGGVGKTTTSVNLSAGLAKLDQRVLLVDLDPQGNATMGAGIDKAGLKASTYEVLLGEADVARRAPALGSRALRRAAVEPRAGRRRSRDGGTGQPRAPPEGCAGRGRRANTISS